MKAVARPQKMWVIAAKPDCNAAQWHMKYTVSSTQILGKLATKVCSKSVGIVEAERVWKSVKKRPKGPRGKLSQDKQKKQGSIAATYIRRGHLVVLWLRGLGCCGMMLILKPVSCENT
jgi:hypothetical protein